MKKIMCALILMIGVSFSSFGMFKSKKLLHNVANQYAKNATCLFQQKRFTSSESDERPTFVNKENNERPDKDTSDVIPQSFKTKKTFFSKKTGAAGALVAMSLATILWLFNQDEETRLIFWKRYHVFLQKFSGKLSSCSKIIVELSQFMVISICVDWIRGSPVFSSFPLLGCIMYGVPIVSFLGYCGGQLWCEYHDRKIEEVDEALKRIVRAQKYCIRSSKNSKFC